MKDIKISSLFFITVLVFGVMLVLPIDVQAQCPMCKMAASSNLGDGGSQGRGLNFGILMMLATPYVLILSVTLFWWYNRRKS